MSQAPRSRCEQYLGHEARLEERVHRAREIEDRRQVTAQACVTVRGFEREVQVSSDARWQLGPLAFGVGPLEIGTSSEVPRVGQKRGLLRVELLLQRLLAI